MSARHAVPFVLAFAPVAAAIACYGPTQVSVEVLTDLQCATETPRAAIVIGGAPIGETSDADCRVNGVGTTTLGDIVLTPGSRSERTATVSVTVRVSTGGGDPKECAPGKPNCIVTTRRFAYREHEQRRVPIRVYRACIAKDCGEGACVEDGAGQSACVADNECKTDECVLVGEKALGPATPPTDAGVDASTADASPQDAGLPQCVGPSGDDVVVDGVASPAWTTVSNGRVYWIAEGDYAVYDEATHSLLQPTLKPQVVTYEALARGGSTVWAVTSSQFGTGPRTVLTDVTGMGSSIAVGAIEDVSGFVVDPATGTAYVADANQIKGVNAGGVALQYTAGGATALAYSTGRLFVLEGKSRALGWLAAPAGTAMTPLGTSATVLVGDALGAYTSAAKLLDDKSLGVYAISEQAGSPALVGYLPAEAPADALAVDAANLYFLRSTKISRRLRDPSQNILVADGFAVQAPPGEVITSLAVDPAASGCVYYWTEDPATAGPQTLRVASKDKP